MKHKVTVVGGAGNVGATVARAIAEKELADVVIIDIADHRPPGRQQASRSTCTRPVRSLGPIPASSAATTGPPRPDPISSSSRPESRGSRA